MTYRYAAHAVALALLAGDAGGQQPDPAGEAIDQRLRVVERKLELGEEQAKEKEKSKPGIGASASGFALKSANGDFEIKFRGYLQVDGRHYLDDDVQPFNDTWTVRRARPVLEGTIYKIFDFKFMPDFGGGQSVLYDGYLEARFSDAVEVRAGKFKPPVGLERLQSATDLAFVERGAPTLLVPSRDVGLQLAGELAGGRLEYAVGLFNGVVDGGLGDSASNDDKEIAARLFWRPFQRADAPSAVDLGLGFAASRGEQHGTAAAPQLPVFRSAGAQTFFTYRADGTVANTAIAAGERTRLSPQAWLYVGPFGALFELVSSDQRVRREVAAADLEHRAWQLQLSWVVSGERNSFKGVAPRRAFEVAGEARGAWIVAARVSELEVDDAAFPLYADAAKSARAARSYAVGVSWNFARGVRWMLDYNVTDFDGGAAAGADRPDEKALFTRFQVAF